MLHASAFTNASTSPRCKTPSQYPATRGTLNLFGIGGPLESKYPTAYQVFESSSSLPLLTLYQMSCEGRTIARRRVSSHLHYYRVMPIFKTYFLTLIQGNLYHKYDIIYKRKRTKRRNKEEKRKKEIITNLLLLSGPKSQ